MEFPFPPLLPGLGLSAQACPAPPLLFLGRGPASPPAPSHLSPLSPAADGWGPSVSSSSHPQQLPPPSPFAWMEPADPPRSHVSPPPLFLPRASLLLDAREPSHPPCCSHFAFPRSRSQCASAENRRRSISIRPRVARAN